MKISLFALTKTRDDFSTEIDNLLASTSWHCPFIPFFYRAASHWRNAFEIIIFCWDWWKTCACVFASNSYLFRHLVNRMFFFVSPSLFTLFAWENIHCAQTIPYGWRYYLALFAQIHEKKFNAKDCARKQRTYGRALHMLIQYFFGEKENLRNT